MIAAALFYYQFHSMLNRVRTRLQRLRQPKYLFGAIVGLIYFYSYLVRGLGRSGAVGKIGWLMAPEHRFLAESIGALVLSGLIVLVWALPHSRAALTFTEAEIAFLFPAPIERGTLLHFKLLKSQSAILFSSLFMTLLGRRLGGGNFVMRALEWWGILSLYNLHLLGSSFAVTMLMDRGISPRQRRWWVLGGVVAIVVLLFVWMRQSLPLPQLQTVSLPALEQYAVTIFQSTPMRVLLFPFRLVVAPFFAQSLPQFLASFAPLLALIALHYIWVMRSDVAFEEASVEASRKLAERVAAARSGHWVSATKKARAGRAPFRLRPTGEPFVALLWKNLISAGRFVSNRIWLRLLSLVIMVGFLVRTSAHFQNIGAAVGLMALGLTAMSLFSGPQMLRQDLRQDLPVTDVLKLFPLPGWQVVLGEILAPAAMLAGAQWLLLTVAVIFWPGGSDAHLLPFVVRVAYGLAAAIVLPGVDLIAILIPNAAVLFFPAWFQLGKDAPRGFENIGQQLILMFGQLLVLACSLIPAAGVFAIVLVAGRVIGVMPLAAIVGALGAVLVLGFEAGLAVKALGAIFEKFDLSAELPSS